MDITGTQVHIKNDTCDNRVFVRAQMRTYFMCTCAAMPRKYLAF